MLAVAAAASLWARVPNGSSASETTRRHYFLDDQILALFVVTIWATIDLYLTPVFGVDSLYPFDLLHPMKLLANVGGVILVVGCVMVITDHRRSQSSATTTCDRLFVWYS